MNSFNYVKWSLSASYVEGLRDVSVIRRFWSSWMVFYSCCILLISYSCFMALQKLSRWDRMLFNSSSFELFLPAKSDNYLYNYVLVANSICSSSCSFYISSSYTSSVVLAQLMAVLIASIYCCRTYSTLLRKLGISAALYEVSHQLFMNEGVCSFNSDMRAEREVFLWAMSMMSARMRSLQQRWAQRVLARELLGMIQSGDTREEQHCGYVDSGSIFKVNYKPQMVRDKTFNQQDSFLKPQK